MLLRGCNIAREAAMVNDPCILKYLLLPDWEVEWLVSWLLQPVEYGRSDAVPFLGLWAFKRIGLFYFPFLGTFALEEASRHTSLSALRLSCCEDAQVTYLKRPYGARWPRSPHLPQACQLRCQIYGCSAQSSLQIMTAAMWLRLHKRPQVRSAQLSPVHPPRMRRYFKLLSFEVAYYAVINNWTEARLYSGFIQTNIY